MKDTINDTHPNGTRCYPCETSNRNVPKNVFLIAEVSSMSGEIKDTYFADKDGNIMHVHDWTGNKPAPTTMHDLCSITGDTENFIESRYIRHFDLIKYAYDAYGYLIKRNEQITNKELSKRIAKVYDLNEPHHLAVYLSLQS